MPEDNLGISAKRAGLGAQLPLTMQDRLGGGEGEKRRTGTRHIYTTCQGCVERWGNRKCGLADSRQCLTSHQCGGKRTRTGWTATPVRKFSTVLALHTWSSRRLTKVHDERCRNGTLSSQHIPHDFTA